MTTTFGDYARSKRIAKKLNLRAFCKKYEYDPSYISKVERGILPPPNNPEKLRAFAEALGVDYGSKGWEEFSDLAKASQGNIPADIIEERPELVEALPIFFRTMRGRKITKEEIVELLKILRS